LFGGSVIRATKYSLKIQVEERKMKTTPKRLFATLALAISASTLLTACDPPMPPEMLAQLAEQSYTCVEGDVSVAAEPSNATVVDTLAEGLAAACIDPLEAMTISRSDDLQSADIVIAAGTYEGCTPFASVPYGFDAGVVSYNVPGTDSLNLGYKTMASLLNGEIGNWNDPAIAKDNPDLTLPDLPVTVRLSAEPNSMKALATALAFQGANLDIENFEPVNLFDGSVPEPLVEGELEIIPNSVAVFNGLPTIGLNSGEKDPETGDMLFAVAGEESFFAAGTQLVAKTKDSTLTMSVDSKIEPQPMFEGEVAAIPYQAIFPLTMTLCGEDTLLKRAAAAFMLRLDSQGALGYLNISQLPEVVRYSAVGLVRKGLPTPTVAPKSE
jgi:hypothetical protein